MVAALLAGLLVLVATPAGPVAADEDVTRAVVLLLDGSGSISAADWQLQLEGYESAIIRSDAVPADGSVALAVVQWASGTTRTEIPPTVVDSDVTRAVLAAQVGGISQIGGSTNPGDGLRAGTDLLLASDHEDAHWTLCMSTDGVRNSGETVASASGYAQSSGVDRYSVIGIEDTAASLAQLEAHYGPHVFGDGGAFFGARDTLDFYFLVAGCFFEPFEISAIEVNQAVQDLDNTVPLVAHKQAAVRVYLQTSDGSTRSTTGRLHGFRNGQPLPDSPLPTTGYVGEGGVAVVDGSGSDRGDLDSTLNFRLPPEWLHGAVSLRVEVPGGQRCAEPPWTGVCPTPEIFVEFQEVPPQDVRFVAVRIPDDSDVIRAPGEHELDELRARLNSLFPTPHTGQADHGFLAWLGNPPTDILSWTQLLVFLVDYPIWSADECAVLPIGCDTYYHAALPGDPQGGYAGFALDLHSGAYTADLTGSSDTGHRRNIVGHEVGHTLGMDHAVHSNAPQRFPLFKWGYCGEYAAPWAADWPYLHTGPDANNNIRTFHAIGPVDDRAAIWGIDTRHFPPLPSSPAESLVLSDPERVFALMSYCRPVDDESQGRWISEHTYQRLLGRFTDGAVGTATLDVVDGPTVVVSGVIDRSGVDDVALLNPLFTHGDLPADATPSGDYTLELRGTDDSVLASRTFEPTLVDVSEASHTDDPVPFDELPLTFRLVFERPVETLGAVVVRDGGGELGRLEAGGSAPAISDLAVDTSDPDEVAFSWTATDADGDDATYVVRYSRDGVRWEPLAVGLTAGAITVPREFLAGSPSAVFDVHASDGLNDSQEESQPFALPNLAPRVTILSPPDGAAFVGHQLVPLEAEATDREDGPLEGSTIVWTSDLDGGIATGSSAWIDAASLSEGIHVITATATDSNSATGSDSITIGIDRVPQSAPPPPSTFTAYCDVESPKHFFIKWVDSAWSAVAEASSYRLYHQVLDSGGVPTGPPNLVWSGTDTSHRDTFVYHDGDLDYWVTAVADNGAESGPSHVARVNTIYPTGCPSAQGS